MIKRYFIFVLFCFYPFSFILSLNPGFYIVEASALRIRSSYNLEAQIIGSKNRNEVIFALFDSVENNKIEDKNSPWYYVAFYNKTGEIDFGWAYGGFLKEITPESLTKDLEKLKNIALKDSVRKMLYQYPTCQPLQVEKLIKAGETNSFEDLVYSLFKKKCYETLILYFKRPNFFYVSETRNYFSHVVSEGNLYLMKYALMFYKPDLYTSDWYESSPMLAAVRSNSLEKVELLFKYGWQFKDSTEEKNKKLNCLQYAIRLGHLEITKFLLNKGLNFEIPENGIRNELMLAVLSQSLPMVKFVYEMEPNSIHYIDKRQETAYILAMREQLYEIAEFLSVKSNIKITVDENVLSKYSLSFSYWGQEDRSGSWSLSFDLNGNYEISNEGEGGGNSSGSYEIINERKLKLNKINSGQYSPRELKNGFLICELKDETFSLQYTKKLICTSGLVFLRFESKTKENEQRKVNGIDVRIVNKTPLMAKNKKINIFSKVYNLNSKINCRYNQTLLNDPSIYLPTDIKIFPLAKEVLKNGTWIYVELVLDWYSTCPNRVWMLSEDLIKYEKPEHN